jgi:hypothetical protein
MNNVALPTAMTPLPEPGILEVMLMLLSMVLVDRD